MGGMNLAHGRPGVAYAEGCCVGGGTEINSAIFQKAPEELLDNWSKKYWINDFSAEDLDQYYEKAAQLVNASITTGEIGAHSEILKRAGERQNWSVSSLRRGQKNCVGTNHCSIGCPTGAKQSMSTSLLRKFKRSSGRLISGCRIVKLFISGGKVTGALACVELGSKMFKFSIKLKYVFVCGGATQTPTLLLKSGLKDHIGKNFKLHPTIRVLAEFDTEVTANHSRLPLYAITEFLPNYRIGGSIFSIPTYGMFLAEDWLNRSSMFPKYKNMGLYYAMARGTGNGSVSSIPFSNSPSVKYQLSEKDWNNLEAGLQNLSKCLFEFGAKRVQPSISGLRAWKSIDEMNQTFSRGFPRKNCDLMSIHLFSSIRIGENLEYSAANSYGKMHGFKNLYIADASLIPESPGVNPQATVMALALRNSEHFMCRIKP